MDNLYLLFLALHASVGPLMARFFSNWVSEQRLDVLDRLAFDSPSLSTPVSF